MTCDRARIFSSTLPFERWTPELSFLSYILVEAKSGQRSSQLPPPPQAEGSDTASCLLSSRPGLVMTHRWKVSQQLFVRPFGSEGHMPGRCVHIRALQALSPWARCHWERGHLFDLGTHKDEWALGRRVQRCKMAWAWKLMPLRQIVTSPCLTPCKVKYLNLKFHVLFQNTQPQTLSFQGSIC